ncbi:MAG: hypothetical protein WCH11_03130 [Bdellovibrio sp.]
MKLDRNSFRIFFFGARHGFRGRQLQAWALAAGVVFLSSCTWIHSSLKRIEFANSQKNSTDNKILPQANFTTNTMSVREDVGTLSVEISLGHPSTSSSVVRVVAMPSSTALLPADIDFVGSQTLTLAPGEVSGSIQLKVENDSLIESKELLTLNLEAVENVQVGSNSTMNIEILDNDLIPFVWTGAAGDGLWSNANNWSTNVVPGSNQTATFAGACSGAACQSTVDSSISIGGIDLRENFVGQLSQGTNQSIQLSSAFGFTQKGGTFAGSNASITSPKVDVIAGSFSATNGTLTVNELLRVSTQAVFNAREGLVHDFGLNSNEVSVQMGSTPLNNLTTSCLVNFAGQNLQVQGDLTLNGGYNCYVLNGTLRVNGNINFLASTNPPGFGIASDVRVIAAGRPSGQTISGNSGSSVGILEIDAGTNPVTLIGQIAVTGLFGNGPRFPEFKITSVGGFQATGSTLSLAGGMPYNGPGSAQYSFAQKTLGSVVFEPGGSFDLNGQTLNVADNLTIRGGYNQTLMNGTIKAYGNVNLQASSGYGSVGTAKVIVSGNPSGQVIQGETNASIGVLEIDAGTGSVVELRGPVAVSGTYDTVSGVFKYLSGNVSADTSSVLSCANNQSGCQWTPGSVLYNDFIVTANPFFERANSLEGGTLKLKRDLTLHENAYLVNGSVEIGRNLVVQGNTAGNADLSMKGIGTITGAFKLPGSVFKIQSTGSVTLGSNLVLTDPGQDLVIQSGSLLQSSFNIQVADQVQILSGASLDMQNRSLSVTNLLDIAGTLIRGPDTSSCGSLSAGSTQVSGSILPVGCNN